MAEGNKSETVTFSRVKVKEEDDGDSMGRHSHTFKVKFSPTDVDEYNIYCDEPRSVLEAIKSTGRYKEEMKKNKWSDENIVIQLGAADKELAVATHFPCSCVSDNELLIISCKTEKVQEIQDQDYKIHLKDKYSVFYIDREGGKNTKTKELFRNNIFKEFKYLCVYGEKGMTVEEALKRDGRFIDLNVFTLTDNENPTSKTEHTQKVDKLDNKKFKLCLPLKKPMKRKKSKQGTPRASNPNHKSQPMCDKVPRLDVAQLSEISVKTGVERRGSDNTEEVYLILRQQFPHLKKWMESRFSSDAYQEELKLRKEDFGKIQASFSEVHRVRQLLKLGESVCNLMVKDDFRGTGFVLFDNIVLTNAHVFTMCGFPKDIWMEQLDENVTAFFNYEEPAAAEKWNEFKVTSVLDLSHDELDYAILELDIDVKSQNKPPGLLKVFGPVPQNGEACIIGHPAGGVKKMDPTCIIEKQFRKQKVIEKFHPFIAHKIIDELKRQDIDSIMMGGKKADKVGTYDTFMFHGSSGSPVFDGYGRVFGLHTGGFPYDSLNQTNQTKSVIEYAQPLLTIFENFVRRLKQKGNDELLKRVQEEAKGNTDLEKICGLEEIKVEPADPDECLGDVEPMQEG